MTKRVLYILFVLSGLIPATYLLFLTLLYGGVILLEMNKIDLTDLLILLCFAFGICGYLGLLSLLRGLQEKYYKTNLILLGLGIIGFFIFMTFIGQAPAREWIFNIEEIDEWLVFMLPNIVSLTFIALILTRITMNKIERF
ncbi:hypothetical protein SAMN02927937_02646 [Paenimyroides aquimaris]|uniref:Uncharacterized protein n=1 Tax=Paenimyroides marinum TaxID=1159016 RepID=A0A1H6MQG3_9FLAO|nr:hypothetical protein [Paenimyroides aquimaris]SEH99979.1 hypothetical protein SAMN02927937_02646 [Paenimyroides aquimaris]